MVDTLTVTIPRAQYARMIAEHDIMTQELYELRTANANYMTDFAAQMERIADLEKTVEELLAPVVRAVIGADDADDDHTLDCEAGFIDHTSLNL